ncbi:hypothetical protein EON81_05390 [bacterium]|nr:MAG: hypothetical protein EON81_05390 [bacterium]
MGPEREIDLLADAAALAVIRLASARNRFRAFDKNGFDIIEKGSAEAAGHARSIESASDVDDVLSALHRYTEMRQGLDSVWALIEVIGIPALEEEVRLRTRPGTSRSGPEVPRDER